MDTTFPLDDLTDSAAVRRLLEAVDLPIGRWDAQSRLTFCNPPYLRWARLQAQALLGRTLAELYGVEAWERAQNAFSRAFQGQPAEYERLLTHLQPPRWGRVQVFPELTAQGEVTAVYTVAFDIHNDVVLAESLRRSNWLLEQHMLNAPWGVVETDGALRVTRWSRSAEQILGYTASQSLRLDCLDRGVAPENLPQWHDMLRRIRQGELQSSVVQRPHHLPDGHRIWSEWTLSALRDDAGSMVSLLCFVRDVTDQVRRHARLQREAEHDALTGVLSRRAIMRRLDVALERRRPGELLAVCFIDLDGFKPVNDSLGHHEGDRLLMHVAKALAASVRGDDVVGRLGGDEFVVVALLRSDRDAGVLAEKLVCAVRDASLGLHPHTQVTASVGVAMVPQHARNNFELLQRADDAMYSAKRSGKNRWVICANPDVGQTQFPGHSSVV
ncbi:MAG: diguanylate cyclase [Betaproteobacteria bacterium]|nr:diguanylate cyclase [Betaproteobacteria bacterium]MDE2124798.1 diguanylate cyclase [Betaproteobacteria bacterium]MDE2187313.1 diguanylate cyclase [Betaproteobacteria bacterium]MDE2323453.1 diguanylate cyclase [Betaproteobacteria bacterium]